MNKLIRVVVCVLSLLCVAQAAYAKGGSDRVQVLEVWSGGYENYLRVQTTTHLNPDGCERPSGDLRNEGFVLDKEDPFFAEHYTILMTAFANGNRVSAWLDGCSTARGFAIVERLTILRD